jgi:3',5'-cyclic AMP phosphodiesterase CpdA
MYKLKNCFLYLNIFIVITAITACGSEKLDVTKMDNDITMFVTTDIHYLDENLYDNGEAFQTILEMGDGRQLNYIDEIVDAFANDVDKEKPVILIVSGDLTNNGEKESHIELAEKFKEIEISSGTNVFVIPGNHDIQNPWARGFKGSEQYMTDTIDTDDFERIYEEFGYKEAISRDKSSLSYLAAPSDHVWLLMLDTNEYDLNDVFGMPVTNGVIGSETLEWIKQCGKLAEKNNAKIVTVMHHNILNHSDVLYYGFTLDNSEEALEVFEECGLNLILSGHVHIQDIKSCGNGINTIYDIASSSLGVYPMQYGVLKYVPSKGFDYSTSRVDVERWAKEAGISDENIISFDEYSKNYFADISYKKTYDELSAAGTYSHEEKVQMAKTMSLLNTKYFSGNAGSLKNEIVNTQGYNLWVAATKPVFLKEYVLSMIDDSNTNNNQLQITTSN